MRLGDVIRAVVGGCGLLVIDSGLGVDEEGGGLLLMGNRGLVMGW